MFQRAAYFTSPTGPPSSESTFFSIVNRPMRSSAGRGRMLSSGMGTSEKTTSTSTGRLTATGKMNRHSLTLYCVEVQT